MCWLFFLLLLLALRLPASRICSYLFESRYSYPESALIFSNLATRIPNLLLTLKTIQLG